MSARIGCNGRTTSAYLDIALINYLKYLIILNIKKRMPSYTAYRRVRRRTVDIAADRLSSMWRPPRRTASRSARGRAAAFDVPHEENPQSDLQNCCSAAWARTVERLRDSEGPMSNAHDDLFGRLFSESHWALRRYVRRLVGSREAAEDVVQEAFLRTYEHAGDVKIPRAFLFSTARNLAADSRRHNRVAKTDSLGDFDAPGVVSWSASPEGQALADERTRLLKDAVERLTPQCRAAFALKVFHACSYKEIAQRLGISPKTVENHIARALRETHRYLRQRYK